MGFPRPDPRKEYGIGWSIAVWGLLALAVLSHVLHC